jgi:DNA-binding SARP family transcriptional activator
VGELDGDEQAMRRHLEAAVAAAERAGDVLLIARGRGNLATIPTFIRPDYARAETELTMAVRIADAHGLTEQAAFDILRRGWSRAALGRLDEAVADFDHAIRHARSAVSPMLADALTAKAQVQLLRGDCTAALLGCEEALRLVEHGRGAAAVHPLCITMAVLLAFDHPTAASAWAAEAERTALSWDRVRTLACAAWVALAGGRREEALDLAHRAVALGRERADAVGLASALEVAVFAATEPGDHVDDLVQAGSLWRELGRPVEHAIAELAVAQLSRGPEAGARRRRAEMRLRPAGIHMAAPATPGTLWAIGTLEAARVSVRTLGRFAVVRGGRVVGPEEWGSRKARDLLKMLVARRGRAVARAELAEQLWPDDDSRRVGHRLAVAVSTVRGVLDPERRHPADRYITGDAQTLAIDVHSLPVDVEDFLADARDGLAALREGRLDEAMELLESAEAAYAGDFLEEDVYEDWPTGLREQARATYMTVVRALGRSARDHGDWAGAARYMLRLLERDPYDEDANLELVDAYRAAGRQGEARRAYRSYAARMAELDVEPAPFARDSGPTSTERGSARAHLP